MRLVVLLLCVVALSVGQTPIESSTGTGSGGSSPWINTAGSFILTYPSLDGRLTGGLDAGHALVFDVLAPFNEPPVYQIGVRWCTTGVSDPDPCTANPPANFQNLGIIQASSEGNPTLDTFEVSFVLNQGADIPGSLTGTAYPQFRFQDTANSQSFATGVLVGRRAGNLDTATVDGTDETAPALYVYPCADYDPESCTVGSTSRNPQIDNDDGVCSGTFVFNRADITVTNPFAGRCPLDFSSTSPSNNTYPVGNTTVVFSLTNAYNAGNVAQCTSNITVNDAERPVASCPDDEIFRPDEGQCQLPDTLILPPPFSSDNCANFTTTLTPRLNVTELATQGTVDYLYTVTDLAGFTEECSFTFTAQFNYYVAFETCENNTILVNNIPGTCVAEVEFIDEAALTGNCTALDVQATRPISGFNYTVGNNTQTLSVLGDNGTISCTYFVVVNDTESPTITCPGDLNVTTFEDDQLVRLPPPIVDDNCGPRRVNVTTNSTATRRYPVGTTTVMYTADDGISNPSTCTFDIVVTRTARPPTPAQRPLSFPSVTPSNSETRKLPGNANPDPQAPSISRSNTRTRLPNPSLSPSPSPTPTRTPSPQRSPSSSSSPSPSPTRSRSPSPSRSATPSPSDLNISKSPYVPSASPSPTPDIPLVLFVQQDAEALLEIRIPCARSTCNQQEVQAISDQLATNLGIPTEDIEIVSVFGREATVLVCGSDRIAEVANALNADQSNGVFVENINWEANCRNIRVGILSSDATVCSASLLVSFCLALFVLA